jgi:TatD DNase family protein
MEVFMLKLIDTHAHLDFKNFKNDFSEVVLRAKNAGLINIINIASTPESNKDVIKLVSENNYFYGTLGIHPHDSKLVDDFWYNYIMDNSKNKRIIAIGEIGLDFHYDHSPRNIQKAVFRSMINIALKSKLPVIIHDREAHNETIEILIEEKASDVGGVFHCFSGDLDFAKKVLDLGFFISVTGVVTYKNAKELQNVVKEIPLDRLLIETDCPFLTPEPYRGKRNEPAYVAHVAQKIADIRGVSIDIVSEQTTINAKKLFKI